MFFASHYLRASLLSLVSVGLIVPAWATQTCQCQVNGDCCEQHSPTRSCCDEKPCCARHSATTAAQAPTCEMGCPCCTEAAAPTTPAPQQADSSQQDHSAIAYYVLPAIVDLPAVTTYLAAEHNSPPGHPALRLHALYRVWLN